MKIGLLELLRGLIFLGGAALTPHQVHAQGRVVINEYMPWPGSACGTTAEFVELLNFGPGPMNIGCYILTDGDYSITIPKGTILQPGQFYVIGGRDTLEAPCANLDSTIQVNLNWNTCGCTSSSIPATGDGFLTDGGSANEQVVLLNPQLVVVDAVARSLPVEPSSTLTTHSFGATDCPSQTFNLASQNPNYETIGESAGRGNSFARANDGNCSWVKDPQQSAGATNNRGGEVSNVQYNFYYVKATACEGDGKVAITITASDYSSVFPISYILAMDSNRNGQFDSSDQYISGIASTSSSTLLFEGLQAGTYRLTLASAKGCDLRTFPFTISGCPGVVLPLKLRSFEAERKSNEVLFSWIMEEVQLVAHSMLEGSINGIDFHLLEELRMPPEGTGVWSDRLSLLVSPEIRFVRLKMISHTQEQNWSPTRLLPASSPATSDRILPNPTSGQATLEACFPSPGLAEIKLLHTTGNVLRQFYLPVKKGLNQLSIDLQSLPKGLYLVQLQDLSQPGIRIFRVSKY